MRGFFLYLFLLLHGISLSSCVFIHDWLALHQIDLILVLQVEVDQYFLEVADGGCHELGTALDLLVVEQNSETERPRLNLVVGVEVLEDLGAEFRLGLLGVGADEELQHKFKRLGQQVFGRE
jgi:hypothetical protein